MRYVFLRYVTDTLVVAKLIRDRGVRVAPPAAMTGMIGVAAERTLASACEQRLGLVVDVASMFDVRVLSSPAGSFEPRKPLGVVIALTEVDLWLLEFRFWVIGFRVGAALCRWPRHDLVATWHHRWWAWPNVWKAELSWPESGLYLEGALMSGADADRMTGLLVSDELHRELRCSAPSLG